MRRYNAVGSISSGLGAMSRTSGRAYNPRTNMGSQASPVIYTPCQVIAPQS